MKTALFPGSLTPLLKGIRDCKTFLLLLMKFLLLLQIIPTKIPFLFRETEKWLIDCFENERG